VRELALFAGAGGGILGGQLLGWRTVCAVERDAYAAAVLAQRQTDGVFAPFPIWSDVETFDGTAWRGRVEVVSGGFPCQDISVAGSGAGIDGERSGLWREFARIICEVRPQFVYVENSPMLTSRGLGRVLGDLAARGFDAQWGVLSAADVGAPHLRKRIWILADANREHVQRMERESQPRELQRSDRLHDRAGCGPIWPDWPTEPTLGRVADGVPHRVHQLRTLGNAQVCRVATAAWLQLLRRSQYEARTGAV
jgi:DNA (cytosine-5)-methyltransferase 1